MKKKFKKFREKFLKVVRLKKVRKLNVRFLPKENKHLKSQKSKKMD